MLTFRRAEAPAPPALAAALVATFDSAWASSGAARASAKVDFRSRDLFTTVPSVGGREADEYFWTYYICAASGAMVGR